MAESATPAVEAQQLSKIFGYGRDRVAALDGVSVAIRHNEFFTLLGPSGCGKTTLLRLIAGFEQPSAGQLFLEGRSLAGLLPYRRPVNTVFQSYALFPHLSVLENVCFGLEMQGVARAQREARARDMLALVRLAEFGQRRPAQLSGGQQQRVALARALANHPKVLLLDEPLSALDLKLRKEMQLELKRLQLETGITFIFVTHDQEEALTMSDRVAVMHQGRILQVGSPRDIYEHPTRRFVADFIGESNFLPAQYLGENRYRLDGGAELRVAGDGGRETEAQHTLAVRPERAVLCADNDAAGALAAEVENVVYFGTDTTYYVKLAAGPRFQVRMQNRSGAADTFRVGQRVGVVIAPEAVRVLSD